MSSIQPLNIGIIGCGNISGVYLDAGKQFDILNFVACADIDSSRAQARAEAYGIKAYTVDQLLADPDIDIVINLTIPGAHADVALAAIAADKHVYNEKPLAVTREDARKILDAAAAKGVLVGAAPDTVLGAGIQTCRKLIDDGWIGQPIAATAFMLGSGPEAWHPDPEFFYKPGGGPMFDMGPYYLTALTTLIGPVRRVTASANITFPQRMITSEPKRGAMMTVETPTHIAGVLDFANGAVGTIITSFDVCGGAELPRIEIYGTHGTLSVPDPNTFYGPVRIRRAGANDWSEIPLTHNYTGNDRSLGVADMSYAIRCSRPHRASGALAYHVLDIMHAFHDASREGKHIELTSGVERPAPIPLGLLPGTLDETPATPAL